MLKLQLREIGATLSDMDQPLPDPAALAQDDRNAWRDSSNDLEEGLDVLELSVDALLCEPIEPTVLSENASPPA